jgi:CBS domain-containing protein
VAESIQEVMTPSPVAVADSAPLSEAARLMAQHDIGALIVEHEGQIAGILTDRDIVVRGIASGLDVDRTTVAQVASRELTWVRPDEGIEQVVALMREKALRRIPVVEGSRPVGIVSLGDLAVERDRSSALADISAAPANQ